MKKRSAQLTVLVIVALLLVRVLWPHNAQPPARAVSPLAAVSVAKLLYLPAIAVAATPPPFLARCRPVPSNIIDWIAAGLTVVGGGTLENATAQAVKSNNYATVYFIAIAIHGAGMGDKGQIGVWGMTNFETGNGLIFSVDSMATEFSDLRNAGETKLGWSSMDDGVNEATQCVAYKQDS